MRRFASIDIGASVTRIGLLDETGRVLEQTSCRTNPSGVLVPIYKALGKFEGLRGIGIASAGTLSEDGRSIARMSNTKTWNLRIVDLVEERFHVPVILFNDCVAALLAEKFAGDGRDSRNIAYLTLSTGVGGAVIDNDRLVFGKDGNAREIGHSKIAYDSELRCACGGRGCVESFIGGKNMGRAAKYLRKTKFQKGKSLLDDVDNLTAELFFEIVRIDKVARQICGELGKILAITVANVDTLYDPEKVIIGGSVMRAHKELLLGEIARWLPANTVNRPPEVLVTRLGDNISLIGAGMGAIRRNWVEENFLPHR